MDERQRERLIVELRCYGSEKLLCTLIFDDQDTHFLESKALQHWYKENGVEPGDVIWLAVEEVNPLALRIYTEWDRDADAYRRYEQQRNLEALPSVDLPIRDLIWLYFKRTRKVAHRSEVVRAILTDRPEISERSVDACFSANSHLFVRTGEHDKWGLKEWGIEQVTMIEHPKGSNPWMSTDAVYPTVTVPLDYVLANVAAEDLVYKVLRGAKTSLSDSQITEKIANYLGVDRDILARASFLDPKDSRLIRLHDGTFALREDLEKVISELTAREHELEQSLDRANEEVGRLNDELTSTVARYERDVQLARAETAQLRQLERERDEARQVALAWFRRYSRLVGKRLAEHAQLKRVMSSFLELVIPRIGLPAFQSILDALRQELEASSAEEKTK